MRTIILTGGHELKLEVILPLLQQEEDRQRAAGELTSEKETTVAYAAKGGKPFKGGYQKGSGNHGGNQGSNNKGRYNSKGSLLLLWEAGSYEERLSEKIG